MNEIKSNLNVSDSANEACGNSQMISLVWFWGARYQTAKSCLSVLGSSAQNPRLAGPVEHKIIFPRVK